MRGKSRTSGGRSTRETRRRRGRVRRSDYITASPCGTDSSAAGVAKIDELVNETNEQESPLPLSDNHRGTSLDHIVSGQMLSDRDSNRNRRYSEGKEGEEEEEGEGEGEEKQKGSEDLPPSTISEPTVTENERNSPENETRPVFCSLPQTPRKDAHKLTQSTNHIPDDASISSRTRQRTLHSSSDLDQSPGHKYPTRHRLQHAASIS